VYRNTLRDVISVTVIAHWEQEAHKNYIGQNTNATKIID